MSRLDTILPPLPPAGSIDEPNPTAEELAAGQVSDWPQALDANQALSDMSQPFALNAEEEQRFSWLGILAKNATFTAKTASTLWLCPVVEAEVLLQRWVDQQILIEKQWLQSSLSPFQHIYQLPALLQQVAYTGLLQLKQLEARDVHAALIERYQALTHKRLWHTLADDGYIHAHLTWHLQAADRCDEIHILLQEEAESGANGWYEACDRNGYTAFYCRDVNLAWQLAEEQYEQSPTQAIQLQCRYAMMTVAHHRLVTRLPAPLVGAFVRQQIWTPTQSITYLELIQDSHHQFEVLQDLIPALPTTYHPYLLSVIQRQSNAAHQAQSLCLLAPLLETTLFPDLLKIIPSLSADFYKAIVLREISAQIPTPLLDQTVAIAQTLSPSDEMVAACGIVTRWPQTTSIYLNQLINSQTDEIEESVCSEFLVAVAPTISNAQKAQVLEVINSIEHSSTRATLLLHLLPNHPGLLSVTFRTVCSIEEERSCAFALSKIVPYLSEVEIQLTLNILEKFEDPLAYSSVLPPICKHHSAPNITAKLLKIINTLPAERDRGQALGTLFPHLSPSVQTEVKDQISAFTNLTAKVLSICQLANIDKSILPTALHWLSQCQDSNTQFRAYWTLSQYRPKLLPAALTAACQITDTDTQILAFQQLAPQLTQEQIQHVLGIAQQTTRKDKQQRMLNSVIPYCSRALLLNIQAHRKQHPSNQAYTSVLSTLKTQLTSSELKLSPWEARKRTLDSLNALLPNDLLAQTLAVTFEFTDKADRAKSLSRLLPQIHPSQIDYSQWCRILHQLTALDYDAFLLNIPKLSPLMEYLAQPEILHCTLHNMQLIHQQW